VPRALISAKDVFGEALAILDMTSGRLPGPTRNPPHLAPFIAMAEGRSSKSLARVRRSSTACSARDQRRRVELEPRQLRIARRLRTVVSRPRVGGQGLPAPTALPELAGLPRHRV
jgi:hypothetical protein